MNWQKIIIGRMMKTNKIFIILTLLIFVLISNETFAQRSYLKSDYNRSNYYNRGNSKLFNINARRAYFGVKGGVNLAYMEYSNPQINEDYTSVVHPLTIAGLFVEINLGSVVSLAPGVTYKAGGSRLTSNINETPYKLSAHNLNINMPVYFNLPLSRYANPYLLVAPEFEFNCFSGNETLNEQKVLLTNGNYSYFNYGMKFGAGCIIWYEINKSACFIRVDCGYYFGLSNTYSKKQLEGESIPVNVNGYNLNGTTRYHRGIEICVSAGFPFIFK
ncbi:PorT family protein [Bacteroidales bacterium OttesenSCG-928-K03]|nr:PorT family protein [Odoribacter sp. OttesenSCG-928-L07]MDL2239356.1 PorT family protein [Bacteroidales bacterium OttesenSCG-928-L14]MDL2240571.1 PorT family protein [Bacteroidales bacterium OttesenSCG-928-K22]MDL2242647.1 PorT family protein [Bacteroidales bacterium OttesenSCG-928-K03]